MPTLYLFRHAKSDWSDPSLDDYDRPLAPRGRSAAAAMGRYMAGEALSPDVVLCSTAARAQQTLMLALNELGWDRAVRLDRRLYLAEPALMLGLLRGLGESVESAMLVAHEPGMRDLALRLAESEGTAELDRLRAKFPTAGLAVLAFDGPWEDLASGAARLTQFVRPRDL